MPDLVRSSIDSGAYMSSLRSFKNELADIKESERYIKHLRLKRKLNCQVETGSAKLPSSSDSVTPSWMICSRSTLHLKTWVRKWNSASEEKSLTLVSGSGNRSCS